MNIFITGASSGIGQALAHEYAKRLASISSKNDMSADSTHMSVQGNLNRSKVIGLAARRSEHLQALAQTLQTQYGVACVIYPLDVRDILACQLATQDYIAKFGSPNIVIACAGVSRGPLTELRED